KIQVYDYDLNFLREIKTNDLYLELAVSGETIYCRKAPLHNNKEKDYHVDVLNKNTGDVINSILPIFTDHVSNYGDLGLKFGNLLSHQEEVLISLPERNYIYSLNEKLATPKYTFQQLNSEDATGAYNTYEMKDFLVFVNDDLLSVFNKTKNTLIGYNYGVFNTIELQGTINRLVSSNFENGLIMVLDTDYVKNGEKRILEFR